MTTMMKVGHSKGSVKAAIKGIVEILLVGYDCHCDQLTIQKALDAAVSSLQGNFSVSGCSFVNEAEPQAKKK